MRKYFIFIGFFLSVFFYLPHSAWAVKFDLIPPTGDLSAGQEIQFTINIDTEGTSVTSQQIGMTYDTNYLEYLSTVPGSSMNSVSVDTSQGAGKLLFTGINNAGFTGTGVFAQVNLKIIAGAPGSTELCVLWAPTPTPTTILSTPAPSCNSSCTTDSQCPSSMVCSSGFCRNPSCPEQTNCACPQPTALPRTGNYNKTLVGGIVGITLVASTMGLYLFSKKIVFENSSSKKLTKKPRHRKNKA